MITTAEKIAADVKASEATHVPAGTKYRVAIRQIAVDNGWTFKQLNAGVDRFTKGDQRVDVSHGPSNLIASAERAIGNSIARAGTQGKMFVVQSWLTGVKDEINPKTGKGSNFIRLTPEQVAKYESGKGIAKISTEVEIAEASRTAPTTKAKTVRKPRATGAVVTA